MIQPDSQPKNLNTKKKKKWRGLLSIPYSIYIADFEKGDIIMVTHTKSAVRRQFYLQCLRPKKLGTS